MHPEFVAAFLIGIAGSVHCSAMCGGVIAGLNYAIPNNKPLLPYALSYNLGRILSYGAAGLIAGALGQIFSHQIGSGIALLKLLSGVMLVLLGAYIGNWWRVLSKLESAGARLWRKVSPLAKRFVPFKTPFHAFPYGLIWGWLPCGLVYSTLAWSMATGDAVNSAFLMICFGLGTLPATLLLALSAKQLLAITQAPRTKQIIALALVAYGGFIIAQSLQHHL
ncbi:sulfite exporter TauE/SafE family protein [Planctobacterium marinum]|uniref:Cytochrome biogenesis protein n=1 Tax=Planctobacterium marinum TaxID=1631968 RepID=A0AA48HPX7_9ALTE|nr:cytochrome biogenesis protein [Planctobacterium marinum]